MFKYFGIVPVKTSILLLVCLGSISLIRVIIKNGFKRDNKYLFLFILAYSFFGAICYLYNSNMDAVELLWPAAYMFLAIYFLNFGIPLGGSKITFYGVSLVFLIEIFASGSVNLLTANFSRNMISVYLLMFFLLYFISSYEHMSSVSFLAPTTFALVCLAAVGRGGIITGLGTIGLFVLIDFNKVPAKYRNIVFLPLVCIGIALIVIVINQYAPMIIVDAVDNFRVRGTSSQRNEIWRDYFSVVFNSIGNILFGAKISGTSILNRFNENLHNSFLMLHAKYGLIMFITIVAMLIKSIRIRQTIKRQQFS